ncbi:hypothetical protein PR048_008162 [Dryococelus australis]|uniref:Uncharacterized protein n=1 Tax=Dryococelus australis TaxID=614101 RepID=A0ABQ9HX72_9NEOP|nr:hypothetical protein PR048_008162 [Dryococelus australis]
MCVLHIVKVKIPLPPPLNPHPAILSGDRGADGKYGAASESKGGETGDSLENPPTSGIVRHDSHMRKSGSIRARRVQWSIVSRFKLTVPSLKSALTSRTDRASVRRGARATCWMPTTQAVNNTIPVEFICRQFPQLPMWHKERRSIELLEKKAAFLCRLAHGVILTRIKVYTLYKVDARVVQALGDSALGATQPLLIECCAYYLSVREQEMKLLESKGIYTHAIRFGVLLLPSPPTLELGYQMERTTLKTTYPPPLPPFVALFSPGCRVAEPPGIGSEVENTDALTLFTARLIKIAVINCDTEEPSAGFSPYEGAGRNGLAVSLPASHQGDPGSIPGRVTGLSHVGIVPDDDVRWSSGFLGDPQFPLPPHTGAVPYSPQSPSSTHNTSLTRKVIGMARLSVLVICKCIWGRYGAPLKRLHLAGCWTRKALAFFESVSNLLHAASLNGRMNRVVGPMAMLIVQMVEEYTVFIQVDIKQTFQKCSVYRTAVIISYPSAKRSSGKNDKGCGRGVGEGGNRQPGRSRGEIETGSECWETLHRQNSCVFIGGGGNIRDAKSAACGWGVTVGNILVAPRRILEYGAAPECKAGETGDPRENPRTSGIVRHDSHMRR